MRAPIALALLAVTACGGGDGPRTAPASGWIDVPGMICADGTPTGIAISRGSADAVLVYVAPGGACWSEGECHANTPRAFGRAEFGLATDFFVPGTILDRTVAGNPFATWTMVTVPYCTGDVHVGDDVGEYVIGATTVVWNHHGHRNLEAAVARMAAEVAPPAQVVVAGSSAGGFGALLAYDLVRTEWPGGAGALVDDSAPTFVGSALPETIRAAWWGAWNLGSTVTATCATCRDDLSDIWSVLATNHPLDRFALVSTTQDLTMRAFFGDPNGDFTGAAFGAALDELALEVAPLGIRTFRLAEPPEGHALLFTTSLSGTPPLVTYSAGEATLLGWLTEMITPGSDWTSKGP
jgi:hypothetical protein